MDLMRQDAAHRTMEAVAGRGPARVLAHAVGVLALLVMLGLLISIGFGASGLAVGLACLPLLAVAGGAFVVGARAGHGVATHHLEQAILRLATENGGVVRVVALAQATGCTLRECQIAVDTMVASGHATVEADETGALSYRIPDLEPRRRTLEAHVVHEVGEDQVPARTPEGRP
jgi:hypothetical protein